jgi:hypothetical protein
MSNGVIDRNYWRGEEVRKTGSGHGGSPRASCEGELSSWHAHLIMCGQISNVAGSSPWMDGMSNGISIKCCSVATVNISAGSKSWADNVLAVAVAAPVEANGHANHAPNSLFRPVVPAKLWFVLSNCCSRQWWGIRQAQSTSRLVARVWGPQLSAQPTQLTREEPTWPAPSCTTSIPRHHVQCIIVLLIPAIMGLMGATFDTSDHTTRGADHDLGIAHSPADVQTIHAPCSASSLVGATHMLARSRSLSHCI